MQKKISWSKTYEVKQSDADADGEKVEMMN